MDIYGKDVIIGNFRASDFGLIASTIKFDEESENEMGNDITITEQFIGRNPVPIYLDYQYSSKLKPTITFIKYNCHNAADLELSEFEIRHILRLITGQHGYVWMKVFTDEISEDTWYKVKVIKTALIKVGGRKIGFKIELNCDSQFGYSPLQTVKINQEGFKHFFIFNNSDDIYTYLLPKVKIVIKEDGNLELKNETENWTSIINNLVTGEVLEIDSERQIITSSVEHEPKLLNDFNLHWVRFVDGNNEYSANLNCDIEFSFRFRRKGGFICD